MLATHILDRIAYLMHNAELDSCIGEYALDGIRKAFKPVYTAYHDILYATVL
jgi:hypothetical protein